MEQLLEFVSNHWLLVSAFVVLLILLVLDSGAKSGAKVSTAQLTQMINRDNALVLDIRDSTEFKKGHIVDALNVPHAQITTRIDDLNEHKNRPIVLVCKDGQRSGMAGKELHKRGYQVFRLSGGLLEWTQQNLPLVSR